VADRNTLHIAPVFEIGQPLALATFPFRRPRARSHPRRAGNPRPSGPMMQLSRDRKPFSSPQ
jgi:hypothetical protein